MTNQALFDMGAQPSYPHAPAFRDTDTSRAAAEAIADSVSGAHRAILKALRERGPMTPDEWAAANDEHPLYARPRFSELSQLHLIEDSGERRERLTAKGRRITYIVWRVVESAEAI